MGAVLYFNIGVFLTITEILICLASQIKSKSNLRYFKIWDVPLRYPICLLIVVHSYCSNSRPFERGYLVKACKLFRQLKPVILKC